jgi:hypothetical protein
MGRLFCARSYAFAPLGALVLLVLSAADPVAQPFPIPIRDSPWAYITVLQTHATEDALSVTLDTAFAGCPTATVYETRSTDDGRKLHHALLLGAFLNHKRVSITTQGCTSSGGHRILSVAVRDD